MAGVCSVESSTGEEDHVLPRLLPILEDLGATIDKHEIEPGRTNILARWGEPKVLLSSHLDTVRPYLPFRFDGSVFWGRGVCDAKGQWIAQLLAIYQLMEAGVRDIAWLGVVGEEAGSEGAKAAAIRWQELRDTCTLVINGEPTELKLATGQRGAARYRLACQGVSTHSGTPEKGRNAIWLLIRWLTALEVIPLPTDPKLGPEIWNLGVIQGGTGSNVVPGFASAEVMTRFLPNSPFETALEASRPSDATWERLSRTAPCTFETFPGFPETIVPFGSDAPHLKSLAKRERVILCGPGNIAVAHTDHEQLSLQDLLDGVDLIDRLVRRELSC
jgi:succinyl-diaminopimelate desuccinylase